MRVIDAITLRIPQTHPMQTGWQMKLPGFPPDEEQRLRSLRASGILGAARDERFDRLTRLAKLVFDVPVAMISLVDEDSLWLKSCDGAAFAGHPTRSNSFCAHALLGSEPLVVADTHKDERFVDNPYVTGQPHVRFYAGCPVKLPDGAVAGAFCLIDHRARELSQQDIQVLKDLAAIVEDEFAALDAATIDELTGLFNRRGIGTLAKYALVATQRRAEPLSLAFIDVDNFRQINDTWGHAEGDQALLAFAELLKSSFRDTDLISRHGADEFVVIFPETSEQGAFIALEYFGEKVDEFNRTSGKPWQLAFSVGISEYSDLDHAEPEDLIRQANEQMYKMKLARKNPSRG